MVGSLCAPAEPGMPELIVHVVRLPAGGLAGAGHLQTNEGLGPVVSGQDLTFSLVLRQIRVATPLAPRSVGVKAADLKPYSERDAVAVGLQIDRESV